MNIITCNRVHIGAMILKNYWETIISPEIKMGWKWNLNFSPICSYWPDIELFTVTNSSRIDYSASIWPVHDLMPVSHFAFMRISGTLSGLPIQFSGISEPKYLPVELGNPWLWTYSGASIKIKLFIFKLSRECNVINKWTAADFSRSPMQVCYD